MLSFETERGRSTQVEALTLQGSHRNLLGSASSAEYASTEISFCSHILLLFTQSADATISCADAACIAHCAISRLVAGAIAHVFQVGSSHF